MSHTPRNTFVLAALCVAALGGSTASAAVTGLAWREVGASDPQRPAGQRTFDLFALVDSASTSLINVDAGDTTISLPPGGLNTGIYSQGGRIRLFGTTQWPTTPGPAVAAFDAGIAWSTYFAVGALANDFTSTQILVLRGRTITDAGTGSLLDGSWADAPGDGATNTPALLDAMSGLAVRIARVSVESGAVRLGGPVLVGNSTVQSRMYVGWTDAAGIGFGVFNVPNAVPPGCPGDANADNLVSFVDITSVLSNWGDSYPGGTGPGDANRDGSVSFTDITSVLVNWNGSCP